MTRPPRRLVLFAAAVVAVLVLSGCAKSTLVVLVRHAEPEQTGTDPPLRPAGVQRAQALVDVVRPSAPAAVYHTQFARTRQTAEPVATALGIPLIQIDFPPAQPQQHAQAVRDHIVNNFAGRQVVVVGHSNTIGLIATLLGVSTAPPAVGALEFDHLFVVVRRGSDAPARLVHGRYGQ